MAPLRIVFMGTPNFAVPSLKRIHTSNHIIEQVVTGPDRPSGRGLNVNPSAVKLATLDLGLPILQPASLKNSEFLTHLNKMAPDLIVVVAFKILPPSIIAVPKLGAINLHASLLPKYRGAAPIQWAIYNGDTETGVTVFKIEKEIDTGKVILQQKEKINLQDRAIDLHDRLSQIGADVLSNAVEQIANGTAKFTPQTHDIVSSAPKLKKEDGEIDWSKNQKKVYDHIRAFYPYPGAYSKIENGPRFRFLKASIGPEINKKAIGELILEDKLVWVQTGNGLVSLEMLQPEYKKAMTAKEFLHGSMNLNGKRFVF